MFPNDPSAALRSPYPIRFAQADFQALKEQIAAGNYGQVFVLLDENTARDCWPILAPALAPYSPHLLQIPAGEDHKNLQTCQNLWTKLLQKGAQRNSLLINLGGGVLGDMGGFVAATFKRGFDFIQIPTSLLAQVDASVGGKLGIDFQGLKNGIGLFQFPKMVLIYPPFIQTLPPAEVRSGWAEILKHSLIADAQSWPQLQEMPPLENMDRWQLIIAHSIQIKDHIVDQDPQEKGLRKLLNFGHSIGHALESLSWNSPQPLLHGEAVALGLLAEAYLSAHYLQLPQKELDQIEAAIRPLYPSFPLAQIPPNSFFPLLRQDKKNEGKTHSFTLISAIGQGQFNQSIPYTEEDRIWEAVVFALGG